MTYFISFHLILSFSPYCTVGQRQNLYLSVTHFGIDNNADFWLLTFFVGKSLDKSQRRNERSQTSPWTYPGPSAGRPSGWRGPWQRGWPGWRRCWGPWREGTRAGSGRASGPRCPGESSPAGGSGSSPDSLRPDRTGAGNPAIDVQRVTRLLKCFSFQCPTSNCL